MHCYYTPDSRTCKLHGAIHTKKCRCFDIGPVRVIGFVIADGEVPAPPRTMEDGKGSSFDKHWLHFKIYIMRDKVP